MKIELKGMTKEFETGKPVLNQIDLDLKSGEFTGLLGPSGCGKTTLLRIIAGLDRPTSGKVVLGNRTLADLEEKIEIPPEKRNVSMVFQNYAIWPHMTVFENVAFPLRVAKVPKAQIPAKVGAVLADVRLSGLENRMPNELSGGQQQRVALARALVKKPDVLLLDEPLSNLDANLRAEMRRMIRQLQQDFGLTAVIVTHDWADARALSDTVVVLKDGLIEQMGSVADLTKNPATDFVRSITLTGENV